MPTVTMDPGHNLDAVLQTHLPTQASREEFDTLLTEIKSARLQGKFGDDPQGQQQTIERLIKSKYPQMFPGEFNPPSQVNSPERDAYVADYRQKNPGPFLQNLPQLLHERGVIAQPKTFGQDYAYPALSGAAQAIGATGGAVAGGAMTGGNPLAAAGGAGLGASTAYAVLDPALRWAFDLPQQSWGEYGHDMAETGVTNAFTDGLFRGAQAALPALRTKLLFDTAPPLTADQQTALGLLKQGSDLAGTTGTRAEAFPSPIMLQNANRPGVPNQAPTFRQGLQNLANQGIGSTTILRRRAGDFLNAEGALVTDAVRKLGQEGALSDTSQALDLIYQIKHNLYPLSLERKHAIYGAAYQLPGAANDVTTDTLYHQFGERIGRIDLKQVVGSAETQLTLNGRSLDDYLSRLVPVSPQNAQQGMPVIFNNNGLQHAGTFQGLDPQGNALIQTTLTASQGPTQIPVPIEGVLTREYTSNYADLHEVRSVLRQYKDAWAKSLDPTKNAHVNDANYLISGIDQTIDDAVATNAIPRTTVMGLRYADKFAAQEIDTFANETVLGIIHEMSRDPQGLADALLQPHNMKVLREIQAAVESIPDAPLPHAGMTEADYTAQMNRPSLYARNSTLQQKTVWEQVIQPTLQARLLSRALEDQSHDAFSKALDYGGSAAFSHYQTALGQGQMQGVVPIKPEDFVVFNPQKLLGILTDYATLDPGTRDALFGSKAGYEHWLNIAKLLNNFSADKLVPRAGIGSFMTVARQSAGMTMMGYSGMEAVKGAPMSSFSPYMAYGMTLVLSPIVMARYVNDPRLYKALVLGLKQTPANFAKSRIGAQFAQDVLHQYWRENEKSYPVLPGEPPNPPPSIPGAGTR